MATPTPSSNTPQKHLPAFSSPAPRSVPPMMNLNFDSPAALGFLSEHGMGGVGMGISMSGLGMSSLGMSASAMGRNDEDERRRRLEGIISTLKTKPGRVSIKGILDLCAKEGWSIGQEKNELTLMIGEEGLLEIPIGNGEILTDGVSLELEEDRHNYMRTASRILVDSLKPLPGQAKVNLTLERFSQNLEKLMQMDKLSAPQNGGISCYKAIFGIYTSLEKLFNHEKDMALALMDANAPYAIQKAEREVLCKRSGRPRFNARNCLGLSLEYWLDRRHMFPQGAPLTPSSNAKGKMAVDSAPANDYPEDKDTETHKIYSLTIECESSPSSMFTPIRISDNWISEAIEKAPDATDSDINNIILNRPTIDWLEPPQTYLPSASQTGNQDAMDLDNASGRLPNIGFTAKFNPPLVVPLTVFVTIYQSLGLDVPDDIRPTTFVGLALRPGETDPGTTGMSHDTTQEIRVETEVLVPTSSGGEEKRTHSNSLFVPRTEYSRTIDSLPFSHPRQIINILPTLRQYAFVTSLLQDTFNTTSQPPPQQSQYTNNQYEHTSPPTTSSQPTPQPPLQLDVSLSYAQQAPHLRFDIPHPLAKPTDDLLTYLISDMTQHPPLNVTLEVLHNAELLVTEQNIVKLAHTDDSGLGIGDADVTMGGTMHESMREAMATPGLDEGVKRVARALEICGDVGVWAEWVRREVEGRARE